MPEFIAQPRSLKKKLQTKIGGELINQGASTNLISASTAPHSGLFRKICDNLWQKLDRTQKTRPKLVGS
ncbi:hypothetical protein QUB68_00170 [Microcoleus sp. A006_D1]